MAKLELPDPVAGLEAAKDRHEKLVKWKNYLSGEQTRLAKELEKIEEEFIKLNGSWHRTGDCSRAFSELKQWEQYAEMSQHPEVVFANRKDREKKAYIEKITPKRVYVYEVWESRGECGFSSSSYWVDKTGSCLDLESTEKVWKEYLLRKEDLDYV